MRTHQIHPPSARHPFAGLIPVLFKGADTQLGGASVAGQGDGPFWALEVTGCGRLHLLGRNSPINNLGHRGLDKIRRRRRVRTGSRPLGRRPQHPSARIEPARDGTQADAAAKTHRKIEANERLTASGAGNGLSPALKPRLDRPNRSQPLMAHLGSIGFPPGTRLTC